MKKYVIVLFVLLVVVSFSIAGVTGKIVGNIKDTETGKPIEGVNVYLSGRDIGAITNRDGN